MRYKVIAASLLLAPIVIALAFAFLHIDWYPSIHTYGIDVGTNYHYCFVDLVHGHLVANCESAQ